MTITMLPPPGRASPPAPPGVRKPDAWGVAAAPPISPLPAPPQPPRSAFEMFGPPKAAPVPPPFAGVRRELLDESSPVSPAPAVSFIDPIPTYNPLHNIKNVSEYVASIVKSGEGISPVAGMTYAMHQLLAESYKLQFDEHGGRLKNGALHTLLLAAKVAKELETLLKTTRVDVNLRSGQEGHEEFIKNLLSIPSLQPKE